MRGSEGGCRGRSVSWVRIPQGGSGKMSVSQGSLRGRGQGSGEGTCGGWNGMIDYPSVSMRSEGYGT